jgi:tRNA1(Val) A37 N6-methylase TrmN6
MVQKKYGVVYTPDRLADFTAELLYIESEIDKFAVKSILDPACGECALLRAASRFFKRGVNYTGIDVDKDAIVAANNEFCIVNNDTIIPQNVKRPSVDYWNEKLSDISAVIANPPWSSEKIYNRSELQRAGFALTAGQFDSYVLFVEFAYGIIQEGGYFAFIIPDSLFDAQNEKLRRFLTENTQIRVIARLGEKIFDEVNRATTVIICKKQKPTENTVTKCFRLSTNERKIFLSTDTPLIKFYKEGAHEVLQTRFAANDACNFDIDTYSNEEELLSKIKKHIIKWDNEFVFGRGVEISKTGKIVFCPSCGFAQGYKKSQMTDGKKSCTNCGSDVPVSIETTQSMITKEQSPQSVQLFVGENIRRYAISGEFYIQPNIPGINYKNRSMYNPPKLLVRKTGLGIYSAIDYTGSMTSQTVYILKLKDNVQNIPLEYYLALLNSRVVYYYYLKTYGENEWKSHPYLTKQIIYSLPIRKYENSELDHRIVKLSTELAHNYDYIKDVQLEELMMKKYDLSESDKQLIYSQMNRLPDLSAVNNMKVEIVADV